MEWFGWREKVPVNNSELHAGRPSCSVLKQHDKFVSVSAFQVGAIEPNAQQPALQMCFQSALLIAHT